MIDALRQHVSAVEPVERSSELLIFLFVDIRGYTRFTQEQGDEAAADMTSRFARLVQAGVEAYGGKVIELQGPEQYSPARELCTLLERSRAWRMSSVVTRN